MYYFIQTLQYGTKAMTFTTFFCFTSAPPPPQPTRAPQPERQPENSQPDSPPAGGANVPGGTGCEGAPDYGTCGERDNIKWYFDTENSICRRFRYSGCGGNGNRYEDRESCVASCINAAPVVDTAPVRADPVGK